MKLPAVQWTGENSAEIESLLSRHLARVDKRGDKLHLIGIGLNVELGLGDSIMMDGDRLGVVRAGIQMPDDTMTWDGTNVPAFNEFLQPLDVWLAVTGEMLCVYGGNQLLATLNRGDKITKRNGQVVVSRAGKDHRH